MVMGKIFKNENKCNDHEKILVFTHGSHDNCCARYGNPFYFNAKNIISGLSLDNVRISRFSHFGGHRFAPTMIDSPQGRYYGNLDQESFKSILTISAILSVSRIFIEVGELYRDRFKLLKKN